MLRPLGRGGWVCLRKSVWLRKSALTCIVQGVSRHPLVVNVSSLCLSCREPPCARSHPSQGSTRPTADEAGKKKQLFWPQERKHWQAIDAPKLLVALPIALLGCCAFLSFPILPQPASSYRCGALIHTQPPNSVSNVYFWKNPTCHNKWAREGVIGGKFRKLSEPLDFGFYWERHALDSLEQKDGFFWLFKRHPLAAVLQTEWRKRRVEGREEYNPVRADGLHQPGVTGDF